MNVKTKYDQFIHVLQSGLHEEQLTNNTGKAHKQSKKSRRVLFHLHEVQENMQTVTSSAGGYNNAMDVGTD